jgi:zinc/manganese transport system substrate-binding protein
VPKFLRNAIAALTALTVAFAFSGCASNSDQSDGLIHVVAATPAWASVAKAIGGEHIDAASLITKPNQDPHSYEATARDQLRVNKAELVILNGLGYDNFLRKLIEVAPTDQAGGPAVIQVAELAARQTGNEHFWFDLPTVNNVATSVAEELEKIDSANAEEYAANLATFNLDLAKLQTEVESQSAGFNTKSVLATEPIADYLVAAFKIQDHTPSAFKHAIENESDAPLTALNAMRKQLRGGQVSALIVNPQTSGVQVEQLVAAAKSGKVPVVEIAEFQSDQNQGYLAWMNDNINALATAVSGQETGLND